MNDNTMIVCIILLCCLTAGEPDMIDGFIYKLTGVKNWVHVEDTK